MTLTKPELEAVLFAVSDSMQRARRDGDLVRDDYKIALRLAHIKLCEEHERLLTLEAEKK